jgi:hypothetical protein
VTSVSPPQNNRRGQDADHERGHEPENQQRHQRDRREDDDRQGQGEEPQHENAEPGDAGRETEEHVEALILVRVG